MFDQISFSSKIFLNIYKCDDVQIIITSLAIYFHSIHVQVRGYSDVIYEDMDSKQISFTPREAIYNAVYWGLASPVSMHHSLPLHIINKPSGRINIKEQVHRKNIT